MAKKCLVYDTNTGTCSINELQPYPDVASPDGSITVAEVVDGVTGKHTFNISGSVDINVLDLTYDPATQDITLTETDGTVHIINLTSLLDDTNAVSALTNRQTTGHRIVTHGDGLGATLDIFETITTLVRNADGSLGYVDENGDTTTVNLCDAATGALPLQEGDNLLVCQPAGLERKPYIAPDDPTSVITNTVAGNLIAVHSDGADTPTLTNIFETITTCVNNADGTFTHTSENGTVVTISPCGAPADGDLAVGDDILVCGPAGPVLKNYVAPVAGGDTSVVSNVIDGNRIATHNDGDGTTVDIDETVTDMEDLANGTYEYTSEDGTGTVISPCTAPLSASDLAPGDTVLSCQPAGLEHKPYNPCGSPDAGDLEPTDRIFICRNGDMELADPVSALVDFDPDVCGVCPDEPAYMTTDITNLDDHLAGIAAELCWFRENFVRYTTVKSPSELDENHPYESEPRAFYVDPAGVDAPCRGTAAKPLATVNYAIEMLKRYRFKDRAFIVVNAGTYNNQNAISATHPNGDRLQIIGAGSGVTTFNMAPGQRGLVVSRNNLDRLEGITFNGTGNDGLYAANNSSVFATDLVLNGFTNGFKATREGTIYADGVSVNNSINYGAYSSADGKVMITAGNISNSGVFGLYAQDGGYIYTHQTNPPTYVGNPGNFSPAFGVVGNNDALITTFIP